MTGKRLVWASIVALGALTAPACAGRILDPMGGEPQV